jgi:hypothetical protein
MKLSELAKDLKPYLLPWVSEAARVTVQQSGLVAHDLAGPYHDGDLDRTQAPWVAADISSALATHVAAPDPHPAYVLASGDTMTGTLLAPNGSPTAPAWAFSGDPDNGLYRVASDVLGVSKALQAGWVKNSLIGFGGQGANDLGMLGFYDRNELTNSDLRGTITVQITGAGSVTTSSINNAVNARGNFMSITGTDNTTTQIIIHIDLGANQPNYSAANWQPFVQYRLSMNSSFTHYRAITCEVSANNSTWYKPTSGAWETTAAHSAELVPGLWMGANGNPAIPGNTYRYVRFILTNRFEDAGYSSKASVWISQIGLRHYAAPYTRAWVHTSGDTIYGAVSIKISSAAALDVQSAAGTSLLKANTSASLVTVGADLDVLDTLTAANAAIGTTYDSTATLKVQSVFTDDITLFLKQKSGQTARMWRVEDSTGQEIIVLDSQGNLQSGSPGFVSGLTGWQMTPQGNLEANNAFIRGALHASIFTMNEFHASGGTLYIAPAGKLELDATVNVSVGIEAVFDIRTTSALGSGSKFDIRTTSALGSGSQFTLRTIENYFAITDPPSGHAMILSARDIVRCKALGLGVGIDLWDVWGVVTRVEDMTDYYRYYYTLKSGGTNGLIIPAGTAIISYGKPGDGRIYLTADQNYAPYMQVFLSGEEPWNGQITPTVRIGRLDGVGLPGVSGIEQHGIVLSSNLSNASAPYLVASNLQMFSYKIDSEWNNGNPTARITANGEFRLGTDVDADNTTGLKFNPATGALDIGNASYPGAVNVRGVITVTGGSGYGNFSDRPTSLSGINAGEGTKLNAGLDSGGNLITKVLPGATIGTPGGAGLFLGADKMGYYSGSAWTMYFDNTGKMGLGGTAGARLAWDGTDLLGTDGTNVQWYARASTGKLYAGNGAVIIDRTGIGIANDNVSSGLSLYRTATFSNSNKAGRLWALSDLSPMRVYLTAGRSVADGGDATSAAGFLDLAAYNSSGVVTAMLSLAGSTGVTTVTGDVSISGDLEASNVLSIRTTAP